MQKSENIEIKRIFDIINNKRILIVLMLLIFIVLGYAYSYYCVVPEYKSTSTLLLIPNSADNKSITNNDLTLNSGLISTYTNIAKNSKVINQVISNLGLNMTEGQLLEKIQINIVKDTHIMEIAVRDEDPEKAMKITAELANVFLNEIKQIYNLENIGIVDEAQLPNRPYNISHTKDIMLFFIFGIMTCSVYVIIVYFFDNTIKKEEDIERYIKIKALGNIPINTKKDEIVNRNDVKSYITECVNTIRTNILYMNSTKNAKTILLTSCLPREGKSWVSANMAISFADTNKKVLLIDADMRKGRANKIFNVNNEQGLSNYLYYMTGDVEKDIYLARDYIKETKFPNLHILTNGTIPPNPSELLASNSMKELIAIMKNMYDIIIIDAPPCKLVADSIVLSTIVDSTVLVANSGKTKISDLKEVKKSINIVGGKIIGAIVNKVKLKGKTYGQKYYYGHSDVETQEIENKKTVVTIDELIEETIPKLEAKDFELFAYENQEIEQNENMQIDFEEISKSVLTNGKNEDLQKFINSQNEYLQRVISTVSDMKSQINTNIMQDKVYNKRQNEMLQEVINNKLNEIQEYSATILKEEINNINSTDEIVEISKQIGQVKEDYQQILEEIKNISKKEKQSKDSYNDEIDSIYNEIKDVKENYKDMIREIKEHNENSTNELVKQFNDKTLTREDIKEIFAEELPDNSEQIGNIYDKIKEFSDRSLTREDIREIFEEELLDNSGQIENIYDKIKEFSDRSLTREDIKAIFAEEFPDNSEQIGNIYDKIKEFSDRSLTREDIREIFEEELPNNSEQIGNIYDEIKEVNDRSLTREDIREIFAEELPDNSEQIGNIYDEIKEVNDRSLTREDIRDIFIEELPNNSEQIENIYDEIRDVKENYKQILQEIKESNENNTNELIQQLNDKKLTAEQIKEILREEVLNNLYTSEIEKIYNEVKDAKLSYEKLISEIQNMSEMDMIIEQLNKNNVTSEQIIEDTKLNYAQTIEKIVDINNEKLMEVLKREEKNKEQIQSLLNDKIEEMQEKNKVFLKEEISNIDYTEQINQMNEMISNLKDSYLELSNIIRANNITTQGVENIINSNNKLEAEADDNIIDIKLLKKQKEQTKQKNKSFSINNDIPYSELEKTATCIIKIPNKKSDVFTAESYESIM